MWLTQAQIADPFGKDTRTVNEHLRNIIAEGELDPTAIIRKFRIVRREGTREVERLIDHHNLEAILAVGYRAGHSAAVGDGAGTDSPLSLPDADVASGGLSVMPTSLDFGVVDVGSTSLPKSVTVMNQGPAVEIAVTVLGAGFLVASDACPVA